MLLFPKLQQWLGYPEPDGSQAMQPGVAGGTDRDEQLAIIDAGFTVMHV